MMKRVGSLMLVMLMALALVGCGGSKNKDVDPADLVDAIYNTVGFEAEMKSVSVDNYLTLPEGARAAARMSNGTTAEEIIVVRCANEADTKAVKEEIEQFLADQRVDVERYQPQEAARMENAVLTQRGAYVVLCVSADADKVQQVIKEHLG